MQTSIINTPLTINLYGFGGTATNGEYGPTGFKLMDAMWKEIRQHNIKHKGINHWVYESGKAVFAGVELEEALPPTSTMEFKQVHFEKYAYYKHVGSYKLLGTAYTNMRNDLLAQGLTATLPNIEIYGHWVNDDSKLETELLMCLK